MSNIEPQASAQVEPTFKHALITFIGLITWVVVGLFFLGEANEPPDKRLHGVLLIALVWVALNAMLLGSNYDQIAQAMKSGASRGMSALFIFLLIGVVIATFIQSGTVASLVYYGLKFLHPVIFLPAGLILCTILSLAIGTSWGTVGTGGIVLIGVGGAMGIPLPIVAGMVISGASFGDKMSPVSDTTNLSAISAETDLYDHIKSMMYTTIPTYLITLAAFSYIGWGFVDQTLPEDRLNSLLEGLDSTFYISVWTLLPMAVLMYLAMNRLAAEAAMMVASLVAMGLAFIMQDKSFGTLIGSFYDGVQVSTGVETLDILLSRGGITNMVWTFTLSVIAISLGAVLEHFGFLRVLVASILKALKTGASLVISVILTAFAGNLTMGESYISIILSGQLHKDAFDKAGVHRSVLSRSLEEGSTLLTSIIPWTTTGAFYTATLGVSTFDYLQWSILNWLNPIIGILFAFLGIGMFKASVSNTATAKNY